MFATFVRPTDLPARTAARAERIWSTPQKDANDSDFELAALIGLDTTAVHDELTRCDQCDAWLWADEGGVISADSGVTLTVCPVHFVCDDPGVILLPGAGLHAALIGA